MRREVPTLEMLKHSSGLSGENHPLTLRLTMLIGVQESKRLPNIFN